LDVSTIVYRPPQKFEPVSSIGRESELDNLRKEVAILRQKIEQLEAERLDESKVICIKEVAISEAKKQIADYLKKNRTADMEELQDKLHYSIETIYDATKLLEKEGKIKAKPY